MTDLRVVLADDHPVVRDGLCALLASVPGIEVAIHAVAAGEAILSPGVARVLRAGPPATDPFAELTPRERQVLELLAEGLPTATIGARLGLAPKTVANHASALYAKLGVPDRAAAVARARRAGLRPSQ